MDGLGPGVGWRGGNGLVWGVVFVETRCAGSLGGSGKCWLGEELELGFAPFLPPGLLLLCPPIPMELLFPFVFAPPRFFFMFWGVLGERGGLSNLARASGPFLSSRSLCFYPVFPLPLFLSLLTWLTSSRAPPAGRWPGGQVPAEL